MEYLHYSLEDFLVDERFQQWVLAPEKADSLFWEKWLQTHPEKQAVVAQARQLLKGMAYSENPDVKDKQIDQLWQRIELSIKLQQPTVSPASIKYRKPAPRQMWLLPQYLKIAAVLIVFLTGTIIFYTLLRPVNYVEQSTAYGKTRTIVLPDQSTVMLNSNSRIRYASHWDNDKTREVWVEGEAFFSVVHTKNHQKFQVKMPSGMAVEVLGTQFNAKNRDSETRVVLKSGKVKLLISQNNQEKQVLMDPSESVELTKTAAGYIKTRVDPQQFLSWTQHKLIFKNTAIAEIKTLLEETYGLIVVIPDSSVLHQKISGSVPSDNLESLLFALSESFNYKIVRKNNQLFFLERDTK